MTNLETRNRCIGADHPRTDHVNGLVFLKALTSEFQGAAVLGYCPDNVVRRAGRYSRVDLDRHSDLRPDQADKVGDYLIGDATSITANSSWINDHRAMKAIRSSDNRLTRGGATARGKGLAARSLPGLSVGRRSWLRCGVGS